MKTLKQVRLEMGVSQKEMAEHLGIAPLTWFKKENGFSRITAPELKEISLWSGVPMEEIEIPH